MDITVIIPTYNRCEILKLCLQKLCNQTLAKDKYEIIIVDDGSQDETKKVTEKALQTSGIKWKYFFQENQGQGIARNLGIKKANGNVIAFIGDDIIVDKHFLEEHLRMHKKFDQTNVGVLGFIDWHPDLKITPFMEWLTNGSSIFGKFGGHQFAFEKLQGKKWTDYNFFYTSNISLKKELLQKHQFDTSFQNYGWEDIELGYRLTKEENLQLRYNPHAIGYHHHQMDETSLAPRMRMIGKSSHIFHQKYPELKKVPSKLKQTIFKVISNRFTLLGFKLLSKAYPRAIALYYYGLSKRYFLQGLKMKPDVD